MGNILKSWFSKKLGAIIAAGVVIISRPEIALYAVTLGSVYVVTQGIIDIFKIKSCKSTLQDFWKYDATTNTWTQKT